MTLVTFIENEDCTKLFGKKEIEIIKKQLKGINLSQSEKNRLSRSIRPKFALITQLSAYKDEFQLKKGGHFLKQLNLFKPEIFSDILAKDIKNIYLFGSFVEKKMSLDSDIDIAIEFEESKEKDLLQFKKRMLEQKPDCIDISIFNALPKPIQSHIKNNGHIYYSRQRKA